MRYYMIYFHTRVAGFMHTCCYFASAFASLMLLMMLIYVQIFDARTLEVVKTYQSDRPLNSAAISPLMNHVIVGGGQEAMNVTITSAKVGHFEVDFFHLVYQEFLGSVKGHFGPVNTVAFSPTGKA